MIDPRAVTDDAELRLQTSKQMKALSNVTRHRILNALQDGPATTTQLAERLRLAKGSMSFHVRVLEEAGLVGVVETRQVRGTTARYYGPTAKNLQLRRPEPGERDILLRHAVADLEASPRPAERTVRLTQIRLTEAEFAEFKRRVEALAKEFSALHTPGAPTASLAVALFRPPDPADPAASETQGDT